MQAVRRRHDGELIGFVDHQAGRWHALALFGAVLGTHDRREDATQQVHRDGLASLADRWTLRHRATGDEEIVCIIEANATAVTVALGYFSMRGVPTLTITAEQIADGEWELHRPQAR